MLGLLVNQAGGWTSDSREEGDLHGRPPGGNGVTKTDADCWEDWWSDHDVRVVGKSQSVDSLDSFTEPDTPIISKDAEDDQDLDKDKNKASEKDTEDDVGEHVIDDLFGINKTQKVLSYPPRPNSDKGKTDSDSESDSHESDVQIRSLFDFEDATCRRNFATTAFNDDDDNFFPTIGFRKLTGEGYAFPRKFPVTIKEVEAFWETDFQVDDAIFAKMASWANSGKIPDPETQFQDYEKYQMFRNLYHRWQQCNKDIGTWYGKYAGHTLSEIADLKERVEKRKIEQPKVAPEVTKRTRKHRKKHKNRNRFNVSKEHHSRAMLAR